MRVDYVERYNADLRKTLGHTKEVLEQKRAEVRRLEQFLVVLSNMAALEGTNLTPPSDDVPIFLRRHRDRIETAVEEALAAPPSEDGSTPDAFDPKLKEG